MGGWIGQCADLLSPLYQSLKDCVLQSKVVGTDETGVKAFFKVPLRGLTEAGCWAHSRRYFYKALETDRPHMGPAPALPTCGQEARSIPASSTITLRPANAPGRKSF